MNANERNRILQHSAGLIFALQEFLPVDDFTSYDAQTAQEGLMRIHNSNHEPYERDQLVHTLENEVDDLQNEVDEANERIEQLEVALQECESENSKINLAYGEMGDKLDAMEIRLNERYEEDELLKKYAELETTAKELQDTLKKEKETSQKLFNEQAEVRQVKTWKAKYVGRNGRCLFCGKDRYNEKRDKYGYCPLLRDCFTCEECGDARYAKSYNTFNGEHKSIGEIIFEKHSRGGQYELDSDIRYEVDITLRTYDERYVPASLTDGDFSRFNSQPQTADIIEDWFKESISAERPKEIMKLLSYYRDRLSICNDTHL
jgi:chromosome segregation ATPase